MADEKKGWCNKPPEELTSTELDEGMRFFEFAYLELKDWAPTYVWSFLSGQLATLTVEKAKRLAAEK